MPVNRKSVNLSMSLEISPKTVCIRNAPSRMIIFRLDKEADFLKGFIPPVE